MSATRITHAHIGPAAIASLLVGHVGLLDAADDYRLALAISAVLRPHGIPLGKVTTDYESVRAELTALIHARIADRFDPEHLAAVKTGNRAFAARVVKGRG